MVKNKQAELPVTFHWYMDYTLEINGEERRREMNGFISFEKDVFEMNAHYKIFQRELRQQIINACQVTEISNYEGNANTAEIVVSNPMLKSFTRIS